MPNATVRANAQALPMNRRAALASIFAAGAALAAPRAARAAESDADLDAELFALLEPIEAADRELDAAIDALGIAEGQEKALALEKPAEPPMDRESREAIEAFGRLMAEILARGPSAEQAAHEHALRQWEAEKARIRAESGADDAKAAEGAALDVVMGLQALVAETPARTLAGLIFKARYAAERDNDPDVMASIIDDLIDMAGGVTMKTFASTDAALVALARELIAKCRANGHDVVVTGGTMHFMLSVREPVAEVPLVQGKGLPSFGLGVDLTPYEAIFATPKRDAIFAAALQGET